MMNTHDFFWVCTVFVQLVFPSEIPTIYCDEQAVTVTAHSKDAGG